jgi:hypothetical protein
MRRDETNALSPFCIELLNSIGTFDYFLTFYPPIL